MKIYAVSSQITFAPGKSFVGSQKVTHNLIICLARGSHARHLILELITF